MDTTVLRVTNEMTLGDVRTNAFAGDPSLQRIDSSKLDALFASAGVPSSGVRFQKPVAVEVGDPYKTGWERLVSRLGFRTQPYEFVGLSSVLGSAIIRHRGREFGIDISDPKGFALREDGMSELLGQIPELATRKAMKAALVGIHPLPKRAFKACKMGHPMLDEATRDRVLAGTFLSEEETAQLDKALEKDLGLQAEKYFDDHTVGEYRELTDAHIRVRAGVLQGFTDLDGYDYGGWKEMSLKDHFMERVRELAEDPSAIEDVFRYLVADMTESIMSGKPKSVDTIFRDVDVVEIEPVMSAHVKAALVLGNLADHLGEAAKASDQLVSTQEGQYRYFGFEDIFDAVYDAAYGKGGSVFSRFADLAQAAHLVRDMRAFLLSDLYASVEERRAPTESSGLLKESSESDPEVATPSSIFASIHTNQFRSATRTQDAWKVKSLLTGFNAFIDGKKNVDEFIKMAVKAKDDFKGLTEKDMQKAFFRVSKDEALGKTPLAAQVIEQMETAGRYEGFLTMNGPRGKQIRYLIAEDPDNPSMFKRNFCDFVAERLDSFAADGTCTVKGDPFDLEYNLTFKQAQELASGHGQWLEHEATGKKDYVVYDVASGNLVKAKPLEEIVKENLRKKEREDVRKRVRETGKKEEYKPNQGKKVK